MWQGDVGLLGTRLLRFLLPGWWWQDASGRTFVMCVCRWWCAVCGGEGDGERKKESDHVRV
jgi:hypothetical protein